MEKSEVSRWVRANELFSQWLDQEPGDQQSFRKQLDEPAEVLERLDALIASHDSGSGVLDRDLPSALSAASVFEEDHADSLLGRQYGPWRLDRLLGRGGMAAVYEAMRVDGEVEQRAAVKLLNIVLQSKADRQRFVRERRILARLQHPNLATLIDGGLGEDGTPYLAMNLIEGRRIDLYCDELALGVSERVRLLLQVCDAVAYAHRRLVIHCDLKPSNILVDEHGHVHLLDFGIARLIEEDTTNPRTVTRAYTPEYAAPEQQHGEPVIGTVVDIYGLGAVLYRLLTGMAPKVDGYGEILKPSAVARGSRKPGMAARLQGDLDAILTQALAPDPDQRYGSVEAFANDLRNWLEQRPVQARSQRLGYLLGRFMRRHRVGVVAGVALILAVSAGVAGTLWQASNARDQAAMAMAESIRANAVREFVLSLFDANVPGAARDELPTTDELIARGAERARAGVADPRVKADMLTVIAGIYTSAGMFGEAEDLLAEVESLYLEMNDQIDVETGYEFLLARSAHDNQSGRYERAEATLQELLMFIEGRPNQLEQMARVAPFYGMALSRQDKQEQAIALYEDALKKMEAVPEMDPDGRNSIRMNLAVAYNRAGQIERAYEVFAEAVAESEELYGRVHHATAVALSSMAIAARRLGRPAEAETLLREAWEIGRRVHPHAVNLHVDVLINLGVALAVQDKLIEAQQALSEALVVQEQIDGYNPAQQASILRNLCVLERFLGWLERSEQTCRRAQALATEYLGERHSLSLAISRNLALTWIEMDRLEEAESRLIETLEVTTDVLGPDHPDTRITAAARANILARQDRLEEAAEVMTVLLEQDRQLDQHRRPAGIERAIQMLKLQVRMEQTDQAARLADELDAAILADPELSARIVAEYLTAMAELRRAEPDVMAAGEFFHQAISRLAGVVPEDHYRIGQIQQKLDQL